MTRYTVLAWRGRGKKSVVRIESNFRQCKQYIFNVPICFVFLIFIFATESKAQIFDDVGRALYQELLRDALAALDSGNDLSAFLSVRNAFSNMETEVNNFSDRSASNMGVTPGYEARLNNFVGNIDGFNKRPMADQAAREGLEGGIANTQILFERPGTNDWVVVLIGYGLSNELVQMINSGGRMSASRPSETINGFVYSVSNESGSSERGFQILLENRILVSTISNRIELARSAVQNIDVRGLLNFRQ
jgi:hypothetical protein